MSDTHFSANSSVSTLREAAKAHLLTSLRTACVDALAPARDADPTDAWCALIMDTAGQAILTPLIAPSDLPELGITLHLRLDGRRQPLPGVPAVYLIAPTESSVLQVASDISNGMYGPSRIIFTSRASSALLERLAVAAGPSALAMVSGVLEGYVSATCVDNAVFTTPGPMESRLSPVLPGPSDLSALAQTTLATVLALGLPPPALLAVQRSEPAAAAATAFQSAYSAFTAAAHGWPVRSGPTTAVVFAARTPAAPFPWSYGGLASELLGLSAEVGGKTVGLAGTDEFWAEHSTEAFQDAIKANAQRVEEYKAKAGGVSADQEALQQLLRTLPGLQRSKGSIDAHTAAMAKITDQISTYGLDNLHVQSLALAEHPSGKARSALAAAAVSRLRLDDAGARPAALRALALIVLSCSADVRLGVGLGLIAPRQPLPTDTDAGLASLVAALDGPALSSETFNLMSAVAAAGAGAEPATGSTEGRGLVRGVASAVTGTVRRALGSRAETMPVEMCVRALGQGQGLGGRWDVVGVDGARVGVEGVGKVRNVIVVIAGAGSYEEYARCAKECSGTLYYGSLGLTADITSSLSAACIEGKLDSRTCDR